MNLMQLDEAAIFDVAHRIASHDARVAYLDQVCGDNRDLRERVDALVFAYEEEASFLESPALSPPATVAAAGSPRPPEGPGAVIGPYKLLEQIGEGGMGVVYVAEQTRPVRRRVALKVIKPGMDTKQVLARFEAERQALAMMDHPNIAGVHDAGATPAGRPYFVMELVKGIPVTDYCDQARLSVRDRLDLFVLVCRAVQHAHQKGVIHRDLKPSNILVTLIDGAAVPKVIDFGVAKTTGAQLTERSIYTGFAQLVGTPLYMSPEQAELSSVDVDTRSDVYALGVLLYELLTGTTPIDREILCKAAHDEIRRVIREQEPPTPSNRLDALGVKITAVSANRHSDARRLGHAVRGELDWIVMKALEKDRGRRYETANDFAADVMRHLTDRPVEACPPSAWYRFTKVARRNRAALTTAALVGLTMLAGTAMCTWQAVRATAAERKTGAALAQAEDHLDLARQAVDQLYEEVAARWRSDTRSAPLPEAFLLKVLPFYERFAARPRVDEAVGIANRTKGDILFQLGRDGSEALERAITIFKALRVVEPANSAHVREMAACYSILASVGGDSPPFQEALALREQLAKRFPESVSDQRELAFVHHSQGVRLWWKQQPGAEEHFERAREIQERLRAAHPDDFDLRSSLGATLRDLGSRCRDTGRLVEAGRFNLMALEIHEQTILEHPTRPQLWIQVALSNWELGRTLVASKQFDEVAQRSGRAATIFQGLVNEYPNKPRYREWLSYALLDVARSQFHQGRPAEAEETLRRLERASDAFAAEFYTWLACELGLGDDPKHVDLRRALDLVNRSRTLRPEENGLTMHAMGAIHYRLGDIDAALRELTRADALLGGDMQYSSGFFLAMAYHRKGDRKNARTWFDRSVAWMKARDATAIPSHDEIGQARLRYRAEAAALLGVSIPSPDAEEGRPVGGAEPE